MFNSKYGQPIVKDGCGVFGIIRKNKAPMISSVQAIDGISCIKYRGSNLGAGYACLAGGTDSSFLIKAFVKEDETASTIREGLEQFLGPANYSRLSASTSQALLTEFKVLTLKFRTLANPVEIERRVDEINHSLLRSGEIRGRIFSYGAHLEVYKEVGYPLDVARHYNLDGSEMRLADAWIAHTRQPTNSPGSFPIWSHPFGSLDCAIVHNGDISSFGSNLQYLSSLGFKSFVGTDSEIISKLLCYLVRDEGLSVLDAVTVLTNPFEENEADPYSPPASKLVKYSGAKLDGPFSVVACLYYDDDCYLIAMVDRSKFRPLLIGEDDSFFYVASEENQIRNLSKDPEVWTPEPGSFFIASVKKGMIVSGTKKENRGTTIPAFATLSESQDIEAVDAKVMSFSDINQMITQYALTNRRGIRLKGISGQRYIGIGFSAMKSMSNHQFRIQVEGFPGNCFANLNNGAFFEVFGNAADDVADTMHSGKVYVNGCARDVVAQALQGGDVFVRGSVGNRAGIQMRQYKDSKPFLVIGESADDYLGEYMAGGCIIVLNLSDKQNPVGRFVGTGMVGGSIFIRGKISDGQIGLPPKKADVMNYLRAYELDGLVPSITMNVLRELQTLSEQKLEELLPDKLFRRIRTLFFSGKYSKPISVSYRKLDPGTEEYEMLRSKISEFALAFKLSMTDLGRLMDSEFSVVQNKQVLEPERPIPPQEQPVEE